MDPGRVTSRGQKKRPSASQSPGRHLEFIDPSQRFGCTLNHVTLAGASQSLMPVQPADVGKAALKDFPHWDHQT